MNCLWVVNVNNYFPEMTALTLPNLKSYADKIGAEFRQITERKWSDFPCPYEKMQIWELGQSYDWNILVDADSLIHPDMFDITTFGSPDHVHFHAGYDVRDRFAPDEYFLRDGRFTGVTTNLVAVHRMCHDVWMPLEFGADIAKTKTARWHIIDEYCFSRNLARFGLKFSGLLTSEQQHLFAHLGYADESDEAHQQAVARAKQLVEDWNTNGNTVTSDNSSM